MNIPSHYQSAFFRTLDARDDVDLKVVYFGETSTARVAEGWSGLHDCMPYESYVQGGEDPQALVASVPDWEQRIHLICGYFGSALIDHLCRHGVRWCHWSEMPGIRLAESLGYRVGLFKILHPLMLLCKQTEGRRMTRHALGVFAQGRLARRAFRRMGVPYDRMADLYYAPAALARMDPAEKIREFAGERKVFLCVGSLCRRKGIDVLLKAYARLKAADWCLVLCGLDRAAGRYQTLARKLGLADRVLFLGAYPSDRIAEVYCAADVFILPSRFDGWGTVLNEAASIGLPLVGTDWCGGAWHIIDSGRNGYRVRAGSVASLHRALQAYVDYPDLLSKHGAASAKLFLEEFTPERNAQRLVDAVHRWEAV